MAAEIIIVKLITDKTQATLSKKKRKRRRRAVHLCVSLSAGVGRVEVLRQPAAVPDWVPTQLGPAGPHPSRTQTLPPRLPADDAR